jgi:hypothetical protein
MLLEKGDERLRKGRQIKGKTRRLEGSVEPTTEMLKAASKVGAWDIVDYLVREKGVVPDITTLNYLTKSNST